MKRPIFTAFILISLFYTVSGYAQQTVEFKHFASFKQLVTGVDFYASSRKVVTSYIEPSTDTVARLRDLFATDLPQGAIFICTTLAQKDAVYEPKILKAGYSWTLTVVTPEARMQEQMERMKSQMGEDIPEEMKEYMERMQAEMIAEQAEMMAEMEKKMVTSTMKQMAYAVIQTMLIKDLQYRSWRLDDMGESPLPDWLDIAIAAYASGSKADIEFLQQNMDQTFPIEDILVISRPFVADFSNERGSGGGGSYRSQGGGGGGMPSGGTTRFVSALILNLDGGICGSIICFTQTIMFNVAPFYPYS